MFLNSPASKFYRINWTLFHIDDTGRVGRSAVAPDQRPLLIILRSKQEQVLRLSHDIPLAGHQGINRTKARLREHYFWYGLSKAVKAYVASCEGCSRNKKANRLPRHCLVSYQEGAPMERVHFVFFYRKHPAARSTL